VTEHWAARGEVGVALGDIEGGLQLLLLAGGGDGHEGARPEVLRHYTRRRNDDSHCGPAVTRPAAACWWCWVRTKERTAAATDPAVLLQPPAADVGGVRGGAHIRGPLRLPSGLPSGLQR
jgi:hypothetical protein